MMNEAVAIWRRAYREADWLGRLFILYMVVGMPLAIAGSVVHLLRV